MNPNMSRVFIAGFTGTILITLMMYFVSPYLTGGPVDIAAMLSSLLNGSWIMGIVAHFVIGTLILPAIYGLFLYRVLTGSPAVRGMTWGLVLWLVSQAIVMPVLGGGFFSARSGGLSVVMDSMIGHLLYGLVFGIVAGGAHEARFERTEQLGSEVHVRRAG
jgi:uncharacterized protein DUF6789